MQFKHFLLILFFSLFFLFVPGDITAHAAFKQSSIKTFLMRSNVLASTVIPSTPTNTSTYTATPADTPTTTLQPLPVITLIFPISSETSTPTITPKPIYFTATSPPSAFENISSLPSRVTLLLILIFVLWIILAGFLIIYVQQFK
jgi:hypothetical protein